ncbi:MAG: DUF2510 domain-containing protein [Actinomycetales bacterium]
MTTSPAHSPEAGWYADPQGSAQLRFFDGQLWTDHLRPAPAFETGPAGGVNVMARQPAQDASHGPDNVVHYLIPVGRSWQSVVAPWIGIFSIFLWILGPVSFGFGVWAWQVGNRGGHGRGRAMIAMMLGALSTVMMLLWGVAAFMVSIR